MRESIFIDETAFIALNIKNRPDHDRAVFFIKSLLGETVRLVTSSLVLTLAAEEIREEKGFERSRIFLELFQKPGIEVFGENDSIRKDAQEFFIKVGKKKDVGLLACHHLATMKHCSIRKIFSFNSALNQSDVFRVPRN